MSRLIEPDSWAIMTIKQEAENEPFNGKVAVGEVIRTRMKRHFRSDGTIESTVLWPYQFSGWNSSATNRIRSARMRLDDPVDKDCIRAWAESATSNLTNGAIMYYNPDVVTPDWAPDYVVVAHIGHHKFLGDYKEV